MSTYKVDNQGRIVLPAAFRESQGIKPGTELVLLEEDGRLLVMTRMQAVREAQEIIRKSTRRGGSAVEDLLRERQKDKAIQDRRDRERLRLHAKRVG